MSNTIERRFQDAQVLLIKAKKEISDIVFGQDEIVDQSLMAMLSGGHALLVGVPGLAKTLLVETIGTVLGLSNNRIQCTPDLMPSDIIGSEILDESDTGKRSFRFIKGPVFTELLMADEINRASPRTQSALLQAMQEHEVSVAGKTHKLPAPFHVLATQNPLEQEGTYPLPEAQLDRFLMQIDVGYPSLETERKIMSETTTNDTPAPKKIMGKKDLIALQSLVRDMPVGEQVIDAILTLVRSVRPGGEASDMVNRYVTWAPGPRASQAFMLTIRARALLDGRAAPSIDDVIALAQPCLKHRMALNYKATADGVSLGDILAPILSDL